MTFACESKLQTMKYTEVKRKKILQAFASRTDTVESFARRHGVSVGTLYLWREAQNAKSHGFESAFRPIEPSLPISMPFIVDISGIEMRFASPPDAIWFADFIKHLG
jgi:hypothetical protein